MRIVSRVGPSELAQVRASSVLAIDPRVLLGGGVELQDVAPATTSAGMVAVLAIDGPLAQREVSGLCGYVDGYDSIASRLQAALAAPEVSAVVLRIDSPGGDAAGLEAAIGAMVRARDASRKPIAAYVDELAASAAYWLAATVADAGIYMPEAAQVGSIGCIGTLVDATGQLEQEGLRVTLVRSPAGKADAHPHGPVTALAEDRARTRVDAFAKRFYAAVGAARGIDVGRVEALDGDVLSGSAAVGAGLADGVVSSIDDVIAAVGATARKRHGMSAIRTRLGLEVTSTDAEVEAALERVIAQRDESEGERKRLAATAQKLRVDLAAAEGRLDELQAAQMAAESRERVELVGTLVRLGYETPATAWDGESMEPRGSLATMPIAELRERVETFSRAPRAQHAVLATSGSGLSPAELAQCEAKGIDPARYARIKSEMIAKSATRREET